MKTYTGNRKTRRSRMSSDRMNIVMRLVGIAENSEIIQKALENNNRNRAFGLLLTSWFNKETRQSVIDLYVDEEAKDATSFALNIINKRQKEANNENNS
jgi:hypothetical protein